MRHLILFLTLITTAKAQLLDKQKTDIIYKNMVLNSGGELNSSDWAGTGSSVTAHNTTAGNVGAGKGSISWDASATGEFLRSTLVTIPNDLKGKACSAKFSYLGGSANIRYRVTDGSSTIAGYGIDSSATIGGAAATYTDTVYMTFTCPTSGGLKLELESTANTSIIYVDEMYIGRDYKAATTPAAVYGTLKIPSATNCSWQGGTTAFTSYGTDGDCSASPTVAGLFTYAGSTIPAAKAASLDAGTYMVTVQGRAGSGGNNSTVCNFQIYDGTTGSGLVGMYSATGSDYNMPLSIIGFFTYGSVQNNKIFEVQYSEILGTSGDCRINNDQTTDSLQFGITKL